MSERVGDEIEITWPDPGTWIQSPKSENRYVIGEQIGEGAFSIVFSCVDTWGNELVAKVLKPNNQPFESVQAKAIVEADALAILRHPNIVYIFDAFEYGGLFYIVVEKCVQDITDLIQLPDFDGYFWIKKVARCLLQSLDFAHSMGVAHCDIHPGNVLYQFQRDEITNAPGSSLAFKLSDLGIAQLSTDISHVATFLNKIRPPECLNPCRYGTPDHRVDIYQSGLLLLQLLKGELLTFTDDEKLAGKPRELALELPPPFNFALEKTLRRTVSWRTASALEVWRDLNTPVGT
tara:strand:+ start:778 stop:1650 length:873 start_codon:yes stop_codon:yes gene_type:complete